MVVVGSADSFNSILSKVQGRAITPLVSKFSSPIGSRCYSSMIEKSVKSQELVNGKMFLRYPLKVIGYRSYSPMVEKPIRFQSSLRRILSIAKFKICKESVEKLLLYAKTVFIPVLKHMRCILFKAVRTIRLFVTSFVLEYFRQVKKGFEDFISQHHFLTSVAVISSALIYLAEKFDLRSYLGFLFKDTKEGPIDILAREMRDLELMVNEQAKLSATFVNHLNQMAGEVSGLKARADELEACIRELQNELLKLKEKEEK